jgi:hypothetical protein
MREFLINTMDNLSPKKKNQFANFEQRTSAELRDLATTAEEEFKKNPNPNSLSDFMKYHDLAVKNRKIISGVSSTQELLDSNIIYQATLDNRANFLISNKITDTELIKNFSNFALVIDGCDAPGIEAAHESPEYFEILAKGRLDTLEIKEPMRSEVLKLANQYIAYANNLLLAGKTTATKTTTPIAENKPGHNYNKRLSLQGKATKVIAPSFNFNHRNDSYRATFNEEHGYIRILKLKKSGNDNKYFTKAEAEQIISKLQPEFGNETLYLRKHLNKENCYSIRTASRIEKGAVDFNKQHEKENIEAVVKKITIRDGKKKEDKEVILIRAKGAKYFSRQEAEKHLEKLKKEFGADSTLHIAEPKKGNFVIINASTQLAKEFVEQEKARRAQSSSKAKVVPSYE